MRTLLFGVIPGPDLKTATSILQTSSSFIDGVELRLDYFKPFTTEEIASFLKKCDLPVMVTVRRRDQGGYFEGTEEERLSLLESLCALQPAYIDLEYDVPSEYRKKLFESYPHILFLSSYHDFSKTPIDLEEIYKKIKTPYAHIYKMAVTAKSSSDAMRLLCFVQSHAEDNIIGISMGEDGKSSRILAPVVGSMITYATLLSEDSTAPGQLTALELQETYHFRKLNPQTEIYCLIGDPVENSLGALVHNAVFNECNVNAVYIKVQVKKEEIEMFFSLIQKLPFKGMSVTMPLKEMVIDLLTQTSSEVKSMDACNTIKLHEGKSIGYNTDGIGAINAIERRMPVLGKHIVIVGAGGAAKSIAFEALQRGASVTIINRTSAKATQIANALGCRGGGWELFPVVTEMGYDAIINCIPEGDLIEESWILTEKIAMDIVYVPKNTPFLIKASHNKCHLIFGYEMFIGQALEQERIWLSDKINLDKAHAIIEEIVMHFLK